MIGISIAKIISMKTKLKLLIYKLGPWTKPEYSNKQLQSTLTFNETLKVNGLNPLIKWCLSQGFYSCTNIMTKKQVREERIYLAYISMLLFITNRSQDWNSSRSESRSWCRSHGEMFLTGWLLLACSACFLIEPRTISSGMAPPTMG